MGSVPAAREAFNVLSLLLDVRAAGAIDVDPETAVRDQNAPGSHLRSVLEKRSGYEFLTAAHAAIAALGIDAPVATHILAEIVNRPAIGARGAGRSDGLTHLLQAVAIDAGDGEEGSAYIAALEASVTKSKPPQVQAHEVHVLPVNMGDPADRAGIAVRLEQWWGDYGVRQLTKGPAGAPEHLAWIGDPARAGYLDVPPGWDAEAKAVASVLGINSRFTRAAAEAPQLSLPPAGVVLTVNGTGWAAQHADRLAAAGARAITAGKPGTAFADLLAEARTCLLDLALEATKPASRAPRELERGEWVYHRKAGDGGGPYDLFDVGSSTPCIHGEASFKRWPGADKAAAGMARRYTNFTKAMLFHCGKYPGCGVYAVHRP